jgi:hypothetical protein
VGGGVGAAGVTVLRAVLLLVLTSYFPDGDVVPSTSTSRSTNWNGWTQTYWP